MKLFHTTHYNPLSFFFLSLFLLLLVSCVSRPWGSQTAGPPVRKELLALLAERRQAGIDESKRLILGYFPDPEAMRRSDPKAAAAAERGELSVASAAWWGWTPKNATKALQRAMRAPVEVLVVPVMPGDWQTGALELDGPRSLLLEPGAVIRALPGAFLEKKEYLITAYRVEGLTIRGYGARLEMRKAEYTRPPYVWSQWRHALALLESRDVVVEGLTIARSGGDGVYVGQSRGGQVPRNIRLTDLSLLENHRQGVSVISVDGFLMEYTYIAGTRGVPPSSAIDFEPNKGLYGLTNCVVSSSLFEKNAGAALTIFLANLHGDHPPVDIYIENTLIYGYPLSVFIRGMKNGVRGRIEFADSAVRGVGLTQQTPDMILLN